MIQEKYNKKEIKIGTIVYRPYQQEIISRTLDNIKNNDFSGIVQLPTGLGKTIISAGIAKKLFEEKQESKLLFLAHTEELLFQTKEKMILSGIKAEDIDIVCQSEPRTEAKVYIASVKTLVLTNRMSIISPSLIIIDECHHASCDTYLKILNTYPNVPKIGFSATPTRTNRKDQFNLQKTFHSGKIFEMSCKKAILDGWLADIKYFRVKTSMDVLTTISADDFDQAEIAEQINNEKRNMLIVEKYKELGGGKAICFTASIKHAKSLCEKFKENGVEAIFIDGKTKKKERAIGVESFRKAQPEENIVLVNCGVFTEGADFPDLKMVILARPTISSTLYMQMVGRGLRKTETKKFVLILDIVDNYKRKIKIPKPDKEDVVSLITSGDKKQQKEKGKKQKQPEYITIESEENGCCNVLRDVFDFKEITFIDGFVGDFLKKKEKNKQEDKQEDNKTQVQPVHKDHKLESLNILFDMPEEYERHTLAWSSPEEYRYICTIAKNPQLTLLIEEKIGNCYVDYNLYLIEKFNKKLIKKSNKIDEILNFSETIASEHKEEKWLWSREYRNGMKDKPVSKKQEMALKKFMPDIDISMLNLETASIILKKYFFEKDQEPATNSQCWFLRKNGVSVVNMTKREATQIVAKIKGENSEKKKRIKQF